MTFHDDKVGSDTLRRQITKESLPVTRAVELKMKGFGVKLLLLS